MCEKFDIKMLTTGAYSPFQNGLCEKNHHTVNMMLEKTLDGNPKLEIEQALSAAFFAKNTLINVSGLSPSQIALGLQPKIPGAAHDNDNKLPTNEEVIDYVPVYNRLKSLFDARKAFTNRQQNSVFTPWRKHYFSFTFKSYQNDSIPKCIKTPNCSGTF